MVVNAPTSNIVSAAELAVALLLTPALAWLAFRRPRRIFHNPVLHRLGVGYDRFLGAAVGRVRWLAGAVAAARSCSSMKPTAAVRTML